MVSIWSTAPEQTAAVRSFGDFENHSPELNYDPSGNWLAGVGMLEGYPRLLLWDVTAPQGVEPLRLVRSDTMFFGYPRFHPQAPWMIWSGVVDLGFWPLPERYPTVLRAESFRAYDASFTPDGEWLLTATDFELRAWPLAGQNQGKTRVLFKGLEGDLGWFPQITIDAAGKHAAVGGWDTSLTLVPLDGGPFREMPEGPDNCVAAAAFSPDGRLLAAAPERLSEEEASAGLPIQIWDLETDEVRTLGVVPGKISSFLGFDDNRHLRWSGSGSEGLPGGEVVFDLADGSVTTVADDGGDEVLRLLSSSQRFMVAVDWFDSSQEARLRHVDLETGQSRDITSHGDPPALVDVAIDPSDQWIVTGDRDGVVRVGSISGAEPHLLLGHKGLIRSVEFSPDGQSIASAGDDGTVRLWPLPDMSKAPLHTLPHDELIAKLHSLTNVRIVEDSESATGWSIDYGPFPGWAEVPGW
jgi:WD40 repeat protein